MALESKPLFHPEVIRQQVRSFNLPERVADSAQKSSNKLLAVVELDSDTWVGEVKRIRAWKLTLPAWRFPLSAFPISAFQEARAAETLKLEGTLSNLVNQAYSLTPAEIELMWKTAPPRMPIVPKLLSP